MKLTVNCKKTTNTLAVKNWYFIFIEIFFLIILRVRNNKKKMGILSTGMSAIFYGEKKKILEHPPPLSAAILQPLFSHKEKEKNSLLNI